MARNYLMRFFAFAHLPAALQRVSQPFHDLAEFIEINTPDGPEKSAGLRKLLEAKDCIVRAHVDELNGGRGNENIPEQAGARPARAVLADPIEGESVEEYRRRCNALDLTYMQWTKLCMAAGVNRGIGRGIGAVPSTRGNLDPRGYDGPIGNNRPHGVIGRRPDLFISDAERAVDPSLPFNPLTSNGMEAGLQQSAPADDSKGLESATPFSGGGGDFGGGGASSSGSDSGSSSSSDSGSSSSSD